MKIFHIVVLSYSASCPFPLPFTLLLCILLLHFTALHTTHSLCLFILLLCIWLFCSALLLYSLLCCPASSSAFCHFVPHLHSTVLHPTPSLYCSWYYHFALLTVVFYILPCIFLCSSSCLSFYSTPTLSTVLLFSLFYSAYHSVLFCKLFCIPFLMAILLTVFQYKFNTSFKRRGKVSCKCK